MVTNMVAKGSNGSTHTAKPSSATIRLTSSSTPPSSQLPPLSPSRAQRPVGRTLVVKVEFVFTDDTLTCARAVCLQGDWNTWRSVKLAREQPNLWSVVTSLPTGYHEFRFVVDGIPIVSSRHPIVRDGSLNWRNVLGPPQSNVNQSSTIHQWARLALQRVGLIAEIGDSSDFLDVGNIADIAVPCTMGKRKKNGTSWITHFGLIALVIVAFSTYLIFIALYTLLFGK